MSKHWELRDTEIQLAVVEQKLRRLHVEQSMLYQRKMKLIREINEQLRLFE